VTGGREIEAMPEIAPCLWFEREAEEAAAFYVSLLPGSQVDRVLRSPADGRGGAAGAVLVVEFTLSGSRALALNGGQPFPHSPAMSLHASCDDQAEVDRLWAALVEGGAPDRCGWLRDRWGVPWQIVPRALPRMLADPDPARAGRVMQAMLGMVKIDVPALEWAYRGEAA
jgi:predicted 3-demethylubiquinone-9 3-methyltransferase (glyoxalase superfamily)